MDLDFRNLLGDICPKIVRGAKIYIFGVCLNWDFMRNLYKTIIGIDLLDYIEAFVDNDMSKQNTTYQGKKILTPNELNAKDHVVMIADVEENISISYQLHALGFIYEHDFFSSWTFNNLLVRHCKRQMFHYAGKHQGERCFIIGNGPSLSTNDLDKLIFEKTFATNRIFRLFNETSFRPTYYVTEDYSMFSEIEPICEKVGETKFLAYNAIYDKCKEGYDKYIPNAEYYTIDFSVKNYPEPYRTAKFSDDISFVYWGATIVNSCIQLAVNMGFQEIYLLGIDHSYNLALRKNGELLQSNKEQDHFYFENRTHTSLYLFQIDIANAAFQSVRDYADSRGIKIYNATRGGKLEIFERIDFDSLYE
jgi:hypothetical protein